MIHHMSLDEAFDGWERYTCDECGRIIRIRWQPDITREVWARGDETVTHTGGRRRPWYDHRFVDQPAPTTGLVPAGAAPDALLEPWIRWMRKEKLAR